MEDKPVKAMGVTQGEREMTQPRQHLSDWVFSAVLPIGR
jgi:hypothetical protein